MSGIAQYYRTLELENGASPEAVKQAYKDLATVWHPDRFSNNARLQQKAQDKLKEINRAYEQLKACQLNYPSRSYSPPPKHQPRPEPSQRQSAQKRSYQSSQKQSAPKQPQPGPKHGAPKQPQPGSHQAGFKSGKRHYDPMISLQVAKAILAEYKFKLTRKASNCCVHYESGPFWLDIRIDTPKVVLSVPCDSVGKFHRALLSIPCKSVGTFHQSEAQELIQLFRLSGAEC